jgi:4'-phosphopantetheinyl transferase
MSALPDPTWQTALSHPAIRGGDVHVWRATLDPASPEIRETLSPDEWLRAGRFHFERDRERFVAARGLLRTILGRYVEQSPRDLQFTFGPNGKPALHGMDTTLRFNLSHSDDLLLLAVSHAREVGVDVELMRDNVPFETLADRYFEPEDAWTLRLLSPREKTSRFYDMWTTTEARLKASGVGLAEGTRVVNPERWSLLRLMPADGYAAALAVEGRSFQLNCWSWQK